MLIFWPLYILLKLYCLFFASALAICSARAEAIDNFVAFVKISDASGTVLKSQGSGVLISSDGWILTAKHVFEEPGVDTDSDLVQVSFVTPNKLVPARYFACDPFGQDFCLLLVDPNDIPPNVSPATHLRCQNLKTGDKIKALGFPSGEPAVQVDKGDVVSNTLGFRFKVETDADLKKGMSGGPVVDADTSVFVLGIVYGKASNGDKFFTPIGFSRALLQIAGADCGK